MIGAFILGVIVGIILTVIAIKKGYIKLNVKKRKINIPDDMEIG